MIDRLAASIPVDELPDHFPRRRGKKICTSTALRYVLNGVLDCHGNRVKLESFKIGGHRYVRPEAISRFVEALNAEPAPQPSASEVARRGAEASRALEALNC